MRDISSALFGCQCPKQAAFLSANYNFREMATFATEKVMLSKPFGGKLANFIGQHRGFHLKELVLNQFIFFWKGFCVVAVAPAKIKSASDN